MGIYPESNRKPRNGFELATPVFIMYIYGKISVYVKNRVALTEGKLRPVQVRESGV